MKIILFVSFVMLFQMPVSEEAKSKATELWEEQMKRLKEIAAEFNLPETPPQTANSRSKGPLFFDIDFERPVKDEKTVHTLRPGDIDIIGAMGDSLSAANGAEGTTIADIGIEYRSICFSVGGNATLEESLTVPNILKKFNPRLDGYSYLNGPRVDEYPYGFNVAVPGARAYHMYEQAEHLIELLKTDDRSNYEEDWKLITLFIGGNDLCAIGRDPEGTTPEVYVEEIKRGLDLLHANVPKMFVNIVDILEIYPLPQVGQGAGSTPQCRALQQTFCGYVVDAQDNKTEQERLISINRQYQSQFQDLIDSGIYDTRDDFTVVVQPFLRDTILPYTEEGEVDASFFAPDCFHFSDIGHAMCAVNLWNNMLEPVGSKSTQWSLDSLKVPTEEHPYLFTSKNSIVTPPEENDDDDDSNEVDVWVICVIAVLAVLVVVEMIALFYVRRKTPKEVSVGF